MASLATDRTRRHSVNARFKSSEDIEINRSSSGKSIEVAADKIANIIVGIATNGLGLDFGSLLGTLKAGISNEDESQAYHKTKVFKKELKLAVIHLNKTLHKKKGTLFSASKYEIKMEGKITVVEAENEKTLDKLYEIAHHDATALLNELIGDKNDNSSNNSNNNSKAEDTMAMKLKEMELKMEEQRLMVKAMQQDEVVNNKKKSAAYIKWEKYFDGKTEVDLYRMNLTDEDALAIGELLKTNNTLKTLSLGHNYIITDVQSIGESLKSNNS